MNKHTPGPWKAVENGGRMVGVMSRHDWVTYKAGQDRMPTEELEANAKLIASAPDLLAALQLALDALAHCAADKGYQSLQNNAAHAAHRAIAKATQ